MPSLFSLTKFLGFLLSIFWCSLFVNALSAQTILTFSASKDNTIYEDEDLSNGGGQHMFAGRVGPGQGQGKIRRSLIAFDLSEIESGALIDSVVLHLSLNLAAAGSGTRTISLHRLLSDWGEGTAIGDDGEGKGATPSGNDATWNHSFFSGTTWPPGGDFTLSESGNQNVNAIGTYTWGSTSAMVADVQAWVDNPSENFGWIIIGDESTPSTAKRFATRNNLIESNKPQLTVKFTNPTSVENPEFIPAEFKLAQNFPNPFNPSTVIRYTIPQSIGVAETRLEIFNVLGQKVRTLISELQPAGTHTLQWDGTNDAGQVLANGVYVYRLQAGPFVDMKKMLFLK